MNARRYLTVLAASTFLTAAASCNSDSDDLPEVSQTAARGTPAARTVQLDDGAVRDALMRELRLDEVIPPGSIKVTVIEGIVELTGEVPSILAKERAERVAEEVRGVRSVSDRLVVEPAARPDDAIAADVKEALAVDPATSSYHLGVAVNHQTVTLTGTLGSRTDRDLAGLVAMKVKGVKDLENDIRVVYGKERSDTKIAGDVERRLRWDTLVDDSLIEVSVDRGTVVLKGVVGSASEKRRAAYDAWVTGVQDVLTDDLHVDRWARDADLREGKYEEKPDSEIADAIRFAATLDPRVKSFHLGIQVDSGLVTLTGMVDNLRAKDAAEQIAHDTVGVSGVVDKLQVAPSTPLGEDELEAKIKDALFRNVVTAAYEISVDVEGGVVTLRGDVDSYGQKAAAGEVARSIVGPTRVINSLEVRDDAAIYTYDPYLSKFYPYIQSYRDFTHRRPLLSDRKIKEDIQSELGWSPFINSGDVKVASVKNGVATLTGRVKSWSERDEAIQNAFEGGAVEVNAEGLIVGL